MAKPDWITLSKSSGTGNDTVTVTAAKNTTGAARSGSIIVTAGGVAKTVSITQEQLGTSIQGMPSKFLRIIVPYKIFTDLGATSLTFQPQILLERSSILVGCELLRINKNATINNSSYGVLDLYSGKTSLADEDYVKGIQVFVYKGDQLIGRPCTITWVPSGESLDLTFGYYNNKPSTQTTQASFGSNEQVPSIRLDFLTNKLLVSGETQIVYKGGSNYPEIVITHLV